MDIIFIFCLESKFLTLGQARISLVDMCSQKLMALEEVPKDMEEKVKWCIYK